MSWHLFIVVCKLYCVTVFHQLGLCMNCCTTGSQRIYLSLEGPPPIQATLLQITLLIWLTCAPSLQPHPFIPPSLHPHPFIPPSLLHSTRTPSLHPHSFPPPSHYPQSSFHPPFTLTPSLHPHSSLWSSFTPPSLLPLDLLHSTLTPHSGAPSLHPHSSLWSSFPPSSLLNSTLTPTSLLTHNRLVFIHSGVRISTHPSSTIPIL